MTWHLPQPMLTAPTADPTLPPGWAAEPKWDGYRAQLARYADGRVLLRSRRGDMTPSFPEIRAAAAQLPGDTALDGELVAWEEGRLAFERLQQRLPRRGRVAVAAATRWPAHLVVFDVLRLADTTTWSYRRRRAALEELFTDLRLQAPWTLTPSTTDPDTAHGWLEWTAAGMEGLCFKRLTEPYRPTARTWRKYKNRMTVDFHWDRWKTSRRGRWTTSQPPGRDPACRVSMVGSPLVVVTVPARQDGLKLRRVECLD
ncbi:hypothetical protein OHU34_43810 (plasmid) [Streptomyces sp. NBC_00080]|uniref:ATP-dependent DNA ligase n=1 Tax=Streptomyces sp. NBC_00080 TaxID=2975645 RepID=UPI002F919CE7